VIVPDINLLLYAEINAFPQHAAAKCWWEEVLAGDAAGRLAGDQPVRVHQAGDQSPRVH
jgi:uncharacterized protein